MLKLFDKLFKGSLEELMSRLEQSLINNKKEFIVTANAETFMIPKKDQEFEKLLIDDLTTLTCDGIGIVKCAKNLGYDVKDRVTGIDIAKRLLELCNVYEKKVYLFGASEEVIEKMKEVINKDYPNLILCGATNGYVSNKDEVMNDMVKLNPDVVLVAMGIPMQEKLIYKHINKFKKGIFIGVGGSFDVLSGMKKRAPKIFIKLKLEWLYRITKEPKRLKRFYEYNIKFLFITRKLKKGSAKND